MMIPYLFRLGKPLFAAANAANSATKYTALTGGNDMQLHDILLVYVICKPWRGIIMNEACNANLLAWIFSPKRIPYLLYRICTLGTYQ